MNLMLYGLMALMVIIIGLGVKMSMMESDYNSIIATHVKEISYLNGKLTIANSKIEVYKSQEAVYTATIKELDDTIVEYELDMYEKQEELDKYTSAPDGTKYKALYDAIKNVGGTNDCKRYKDTANALNGFDLNKL